MSMAAMTVPECFSTKHSGTRLTFAENDKQVTNVDKHTSSVAYGQNVISCTSNQQIYQWALLIVKLENQIVIGIDDAAAQNTQTEFHRQKYTPSYGIDELGTVYNCGEIEVVTKKQMFSGERIIVTLDLNAQTLEFAKRSTALAHVRFTLHTIQHIKVDHDQQYRLAVYLPSAKSKFLGKKTSTVKVVDFTIEPPLARNVNNLHTADEDMDPAEMKIYDEVEDEDTHNDEQQEHYVLSDSFVDKGRARSRVTFKVDALSNTLEAGLSGLELVADDEKMALNLQPDPGATQQIELEDLQERNKRLAAQNNELKRRQREMQIEIRTLQDKVEALEEEKKEYELKIVQLEEDASRSQQHYTQWSPNQVLQWILSLDNGAFLVYESTLKEEIIKGLVRGNDLPNMTHSDLQSFGIAIFSHRKSLLDHIHELTTRSLQMKNVTSEGKQHQSLENHSNTPML